MKKEQIVTAILNSVREDINDFVEEESAITDSIEYEERVLEISRKVAQVLIEQTSGKLPKSRNSKKKF